MLKIDNTYWNKKGKYQTFVTETLIDDLQIKKGLKDKYKKMVHRYYRFYNDGDLPRGNAYKGIYDKQKIAEILEYQINLVIEEILIALA